LHSVHSTEKCITGPQLICIIILSCVCNDYCHSGIQYLPQTESTIHTATWFHYRIICNNHI